MVLGLIITFITFPGIIMHEFAHKLFCNLAGVPVHEVCYFRFGDPAGYVEHRSPKKYSQAFFITVAPFLVNSLLAFFIFSFIINVTVSEFITNIFLIWLGTSIGMHAFPSSGDADNLWMYSRKAWKSNLFALIGFPLALLIKLANILSVFWFSFVYTVGLYILAGGLY